MNITRNAKGEGSFRIKDSGSIEYRFSYIDEYGIVKRKSMSGVSENHCLERAEQFLYKIEQKKNGRDLDATIPQLVRRKLDDDFEKNYTGEQGYARNLETLAIIEKSAIAYVPIVDIKEFHLESFFQQITRYSNNTISKIYAMIKLAFYLAEANKIIRDDITKSRNLKCPKSDKRDRKVRGMTEEEQKRFVTVLEEHKVPFGSNTYKLQLLIELYSGMRMGEINALRPEDIYFNQGLIHVCRTITVGKDKRQFVKDGTKTVAGERDVPISKPLEKILRQALEEMKDNPEGLIFYNHKNKSLISTSSVCAFYRRLCEKANIPYYGQHALRHTFATRCIEAGVPALVLKNWLGHTDIHITLDTYSDVFDRMNLGAISKFEEFMKEVMADE